MEKTYLRPQGIDRCSYQTQSRPVGLSNTRVQNKLLRDFTILGEENNRTKCHCAILRTGLKKSTSNSFHK